MSFNCSPDVKFIARCKIRNGSEILFLCEVFRKVDHLKNVLQFFGLTLPSSWSSRSTSSTPHLFVQKHQHNLITQCGAKLQLVRCSNNAICLYWRGDYLSPRHISKIFNHSLRSSSSIILNHPSIILFNQSLVQFVWIDEEIICHDVTFPKILIIPLIILQSPFNRPSTILQSFSSINLLCCPTKFSTKSKARTRKSSLFRYVQHIHI